jgi:beta-N-acetylhexosaminidase
MRTLAAVMALALVACAARAESRPRTAPVPPVGEILLAGFRGTEVEGNEEIRALVCDVKVGGVILYERDLATGGPRNMAAPEQIKRLTTGLQRLARQCVGRPLLIAVDAEGGQVMRLSARLGYLPGLSARELGAMGDDALTELEARRVGAMLREAGINWNLAPVVDVAVNPDNPAVVALGRTFSSDPDRVVAQARAFVQGMRAEGVLTSLKHFPGHGSSLKDSHHGFTDVSDTAQLDVELLPYRTLIAAGLADSVMTAHVFNRRIDPWDPATLSRYTIARLLRAKLGYKGLVVSDDLLMGAIVQRYGVEEASVRALAAGVDVLLISGQGAKDGSLAAARAVAALRRGLAQGLVSRKRVHEAIGRVKEFRGRLAF